MTTYLNPGTAERERFGLSAGTASGDFAFMAGMALDWTTMQRSVDAVTIADETRMCLARIEAGLAEAGAVPGDIVKVTCWTPDAFFRDECLETVRSVLGPGPLLSVLVAGVAGDCRVEIDTVAYREGMAA